MVIVVNSNPPSLIQAGQPTSDIYNSPTKHNAVVFDVRRNLEKPTLAILNPTLPAQCTRKHLSTFFASIIFGDSDSS